MKTLVLSRFLVVGLGALLTVRGASGAENIRYICNEIESRMITRNGALNVELSTFTMSLSDGQLYSDHPSFAYDKKPLEVVQFKSPENWTAQRQHTLVRVGQYFDEPQLYVSWSMTSITSVAGAVAECAVDSN